MDCVYRNYFEAPQPLNNKHGYLKFIESVHDYSKRCYTFEKITENDIPLAIMFILNLFKALNQILNFQIDQHQSLKFQQFIYQYIERNFVENYKSTEIPILYAMILNKKAQIIQHFGFIGNQTNVELLSLKSIKCQQLALKYIVIHQTEMKNNNSSHLSKIVLKRTTNSLLYGVILLNLTAMYNNQSQTENAMRLMHQSFIYFVENQHKYSIYNCKYGYVALDFVVNMIDCLCVWDYYQNKPYQKRYKRLLKIACKSWKMLCFSEQQTFFNERYGLNLVMLGRYYALFSQRKDKFSKALTLLYKGINIMRRYDKYNAALADIYYFLLTIEQSLSNYDKCREILKMTMDFNKYHNLVKQFEINKHVLKKLNLLQHITKFGRFHRGSQVNAFSVFMQMRKKTTQKEISNKYLLRWVEYFNNDKSYEIMKNLCGLKECNYFRCNAKNGNLKKCSQCKSVYYCSRKHQKKDWKIQHNAKCVILNKRNLKYSNHKGWLKWMQVKDNEHNCFRFFDVY